MNNLPELQAIQLDALREVASIGAGHATTALAQMTGRNVMISVPAIIVADHDNLPREIGDPQEYVAATWMQVLGDLTGRTAMVMNAAHAKGLCAFLLEQTRDSAETFDEMEQSTLKEVGNIIGAAYLNALSSFMEMMLLPSAPSLVIDTLANAFTKVHLLPEGRRQVILAAITEFLLMDEPRQKLNGQLLLLPDSASLQEIFRVLKLS